MKDKFTVVISDNLDKILKKLKRKNPQIVIEIKSQIFKIIKFPEIGKPLRYNMKNSRRVHIGSFVLVYKIINNEIHFLDFDHHDNVYKK